MNTFTKAHFLCKGYGLTARAAYGKRGKVFAVTKEGNGVKLEIIRLWVDHVNIILGCYHRFKIAGRSIFVSSPNNKILFGFFPPIGYYKVAEAHSLLIAVFRS